MSGAEERILSDSFYGVGNNYFIRIAVIEGTLGNIDYSLSESKLHRATLVEGLRADLLYRADIKLPYSVALIEGTSFNALYTVGNCKFGYRPTVLERAVADTDKSFGEWNLAKSGAIGKCVYSYEANIGVKLKRFYIKALRLNTEQIWIALISYIKRAIVLIVLKKRTVIKAFEPIILTVSGMEM